MAWGDVYKRQSPGSYTLAAAVYNPQSGWRVPVRGPGAMGDMLRLGEVRVAR